jgi:hypothetical protein
LRLFEPNSTYDFVALGCRITASPNPTYYQPGYGCFGYSGLWLPLKSAHGNSAVGDLYALTPQSANLSFVGIGAFWEGNLAVATDNPKPGDTVTGGQLAQGSAYVSSLAPQAGHGGYLAVAGHLAGRDCGDDLPDFLVLCWFGHDLGVSFLVGLRVANPTYGPELNSS